MLGGEWKFQANYVEPSDEETALVGEGALGTEVRIGTLDRFPGEIPAAAREALGKSKKFESFWIGVGQPTADSAQRSTFNVQRSTLFIVGKEEVADLYGVYRFLDDKLGIRWFKPARADDPGDYVPKADRIAFEAYTEFREPDFEQRRFDKCSAATQVPAWNAEAWAVRNGYQIECSPCWWPAEKVRFREYHLNEYFEPRCTKRRTNLGGGHMIFAAQDVWPPDDRHFAEHPEYFALVDGKRVKGRQYCYSNTNLLEIAADRAIEKLDRTGGLGEYVFALWDSASGACECGNCRAMATPEENLKGIESTRFHKFVNVIADRIYAKYPKADLLYLAYWTYRYPADPSVPHDPRMDVQHCLSTRCYGHAFEDPKCSRNAVLYREMQEWAKISPRVFTYEYFSATPDNYCPGELDFAKDMKTYHRLGLTGWKEEAIFEDATFAGKKRGTPEWVRESDRMTSIWQRYYICGKLSWDASLDPQALLEEAESKYYGVAYPAMKRYHDYRRKLWHSNPNCMGYPTGDQRTPALLNTAGAKEKLYRALEVAEKLAKDDPVVRSRLALDRRWFEWYWVEPNERLRATAGKALAAPAVPKNSITIDGSGADEAWFKAPFTDDFTRSETFAGRKATKIPAELSTTVSMCQDGENLYFFIEAKEPAPAKMKLEGTKDLAVWGDDAIEIFLYPPSMDNRYYHIAVNAKGEVYDARCPGNESAWDAGVTAAGRILADRYRIELKVPVKGMHPLVVGETWKVNFARARTIKDDLTPRGDNWSLGGAGYHDILAYRSMQIGGGRNYIANGSFEELDDKGVPKYWSFAYGAAKVEKVGENSVVRVTGDTVFEYLKLGQPKQPVKLRYSFRAKGKGMLRTFFYSFTDSPNGTANGYSRKFNANHPGSTFELTDDWKQYSAEFENPANETCGLAFTSGSKGFDCVLDDVAAVKTE